MSTTPAPEATSKTIPAANVSRATARALVDASLAAAAQIGTPTAVAITDAAGHLIAFERTDDAAFLAVQVAIDKAWTSASYRLPTHVWNDLIRKPEIAPLANIPRVVPVGGGCPIMQDGVLVGAIGTSGGDYNQDRQVAEAALKAVGFDVLG